MYKNRNRQMITTQLPVSRPPNIIKEDLISTLQHQFIHTHGIVDIKKAPNRSKSRGKSHEFLRYGREITYHEGNARSCLTDVHAKYCRNFPISYLNIDQENPTYIHADRKLIQFHKNCRVVALWNISGYYYSGKISQILGSNRADVSFDNGRAQYDQSFENIFKLKQKRKLLKVTDYVLGYVKIDNHCWAPGVIIDIIQTNGEEFYRVLYHNGKIEVNSFDELIKIKELRYFHIVDMINAINLKNNNQSKSDFQDYSIEDVDGDLNILGNHYFRMKTYYDPLLQSHNLFTSNEIEDEDVSSKMLTLRTKLPALSVGNKVLVKWPNDNWYYPSVVLQVLENFKYKVLNILKNEAFIHREDIVDMNADNEHQINDTVIARHPTFRFAYAPGEIIAEKKSKLIIRFYDYWQAYIERTDVYKLHLCKFEHDVKSILNYEKKWLGFNILAYNNRSKLFEKGKIVKRVGTNRQYLVEFVDNDQNSIEEIQNAYLMFFLNAQSNQSKQDKEVDFFKENFE